MQFVNPIFLYGLIALAIPVIIHLFNFRRFKKVFFTNVAFIAELKQETQKQSRLRHLIILVLRMLAIAALVIGFSRPFIPINKDLSKTESVNHVSIYFDNSFSMQLESDQGMLLDLGKNRAEEIANAYSLSDRFQLLTNDFEGRHHRFVSRDEFVDWVEEVKPSAVFKTFGDILQRAGDLEKSEELGNLNLYILSDFQKRFLEKIETPIDSSANVYWVPLQSDNTNNIYIDSCWFVEPVRMPNETAKIYARVQNASFTDIEAVPINLKINEAQKAVSSLEIKAGESQTVELDFTHTGKGIQFGEISLNDFPIDFDNQFYFSFQVSEIIRVLNIFEGKPNPYLNSFYENDSVFLYENVEVGQLDYSSLRDHDLIILSDIIDISSGLAQELNRYVEEGGSLAVFPSAKADLISYNSFLQKLRVSTYSTLDTSKQKVDYINWELSLFKGVFSEVSENIDLPKVKSWFRVKFTQRTQQVPILSMQNGKPFLNLNQSGKGKVYLCAAGLQAGFSNFQQHAIFVPIMYNMALDGLEGSQNSYVIGLDEVIRIRTDIKGDQVFKILSQDKKLETIPGHTNQNGSMVLNLYDQIIEAGNYTLLYANSPLRGLSFNYDRSESIMDFYSRDELVKMLDEPYFKQIQLLEAGSGSLGKLVSEINTGIPLWRWFVLAALAFLLMEVILLRFWKK